MTLKNIDGLTMAIGRWKDVSGVRVCKARYVSGKTYADWKQCYIAHIGNHFAHGKTIAEAIEDAEFKALEATDASKIIADIRSTGVVTFAQFRAITRACQTGLRHGLESRGVDPDTQSMPIDQALDLMSGDEFGEQFIQKFNEATA